MGGGGDPRVSSSGPGFCPHAAPRGPGCSRPEEALTQSRSIGVRIVPAQVNVCALVMMWVQETVISTAHGIGKVVKK